MKAKSGDGTVAFEIDGGVVKEVFVDLQQYRLRDDAITHAIAEALTAFLSQLRPDEARLAEIRAEMDLLQEESRAHLGALHADRERAIRRMESTTDEAIEYWRRIERATQHLT